MISSNVRTAARGALAALLLAGGAAAALPAQQLGVDTASFDRSVRPQDDF